MSFPKLGRVKRQLDDFDIEGMIGQGNFSEVFRARNKIDDQLYALKQFDKKKVERLRKTQDVLIEKHSLARLNHPNIPTLWDTWSDQVAVYIVSELCDVDLWDLTWKSGIPEEV